MFEKIRDSLLALLAATIFLGVIVFWGAVLNFLQTNPWYVNIAIFVGIGFIAEQIQRWRKHREAKKESDRLVDK